MSLFDRPEPQDPMPDEYVDNEMGHPQRQDKWSPGDRDNAAGRRAGGRLRHMFSRVWGRIGM